MAIELNGNTKVAFRVAEVVGIFGALLKSVQHEILMAERIKNENRNLNWPNPVAVHDTIRKYEE